MREGIIIYYWRHLMLMMACFQIGFPGAVDLHVSDRPFELNDG